MGVALLLVSATRVAQGLVAVLIVALLLLLSVMIVALLLGLPV